MSHCPPLDRDALSREAIEPTRATVAARPTKGPVRTFKSWGDSAVAPVLSMMVVVVLAVLCITLTRSVGLVAALWVAGGVAAAAWLRFSRSREQDLMFGLCSAVAFLTANLMVGNPQIVSLSFTIANMLEVVCLVWLGRTFVPHQQVNSVRGQFGYLVAAGLAPIPSAIFIVSVLSLLGQAQYQALSIMIWWSSHAIGFAVVGGFLLSLKPAFADILRRPARLLEAAGLLLLLLATCYLIFFRLGLDSAFLILPVLALTAVRFRVAGVCLALLLVVGFAVVGTLHGHGSNFGGLQDPSAKVAVTLILLTLGCLPVSLLAALLNDNERLARKERLARDKAERASEAKSRLLANVAHEIKSPITGVIGLAQLWKEGRVPASGNGRDDMADMLLKTARQIESLSNDLLDMARAEAGMIRVEPRQMDARILLEDVASALSLRADASALDIRIEAPPTLPVMADPQRLGQIMTNLAVNAVKYGASGGSVILQGVVERDRVRLSVIDAGPGLSPEKQAELFEPFNRLGMERSTIEGHGIGLAVARRLVELQNGAIGVESAPGEGAEFWVELPAA